MLDGKGVRRSASSSGRRCSLSRRCMGFIALELRRLTCLLASHGKTQIGYSCRKSLAYINLNRSASSLISDWFHYVTFSGWFRARMPASWISYRWTDQLLLNLHLKIMCCNVRCAKAFEIWNIYSKTLTLLIHTPIICSKICRDSLLALYWPQTGQLVIWTLKFR